MAGWEIVIGLEVHCELRTRTKLFCGCRNAFGDEPNTNVCPVCLGLPGSLPVLNRQAVEYAIRIGTALHCTVQPSLFHRKNYFYPDMPKDYQISQYDVPINTDGWLELPSGKRVGMIRAHIEEDTGKTTHVGGGGRIHEASHSLVDYNRAGVPLVEIVSAPDMRSAEEAREYVEELRAVLVATGASDGKMEEGSLRVDCNVSVRPEGSSELGTRCEIKNMNSLRSLAHAVTTRLPDKWNCSLTAGGGPGDAALGRSGRPYPLDAFQGGGVRLPLFPRAGLGGTGPRAGVGRSVKVRSRCCRPRGGHGWPRRPACRPRRKPSQPLCGWGWTAHDGGRIGKSGRRPGAAQACQRGRRRAGRRSGETGHRPRRLSCACWPWKRTES